MTGEEQRTLIKQAVRLTALGYEVEAARLKVKKLSENTGGSSFYEKMKAVQDFQALDSEWKRLEQEYLRYRRQLAKKSAQPCDTEQDNIP